MITHYQAKQLLGGLEGDPETVAKLAEYIRAQERGPADFEALSDREHANRAANRAVEAISRVGTMQTDLRGHEARIAALEAQGRDLGDILGEVLAMIEGNASA